MKTFFNIYIVCWIAAFIAIWFIGENKHQKAVAEQEKSNHYFDSIKTADIHRRIEDDNFLATFKAKKFKEVPDSIGNKWREFGLEKSDSVFKFVVVDHKNKWHYFIDSHYHPIHFTTWASVHYNINEQ